MDPDGAARATHHEQSQAEDEEQARYSHPGSPVPPRDEGMDPEGPARAAHRRETQADREEQVEYSHPGSPVPPGDVER